MSTVETVIGIFTAIGAMATAGSFIYLLINQKNSQKQIDNLTHIAETFQRHYEMERIIARNRLYPNLVIKFKHDTQYGLKLLIKNNSYSIEIYRIIINAGRSYDEIYLKRRENYISVIQGETKPVVPAIYTMHPFYGLDDIHIRILMITPYHEAFEVRFSYSNGNSFQTEPVIKPYREEDHEYGKTVNNEIKSYTVHGGIKGCVEDNFPEINKEFENEIPD